MKIKLKDNLIFRSTVDGEDIRVGNQPTTVSDKTGEYLLKSFPVILELDSSDKKSEREVK